MDKEESENERIKYKEGKEENENIGFRESRNIIDNNEDESIVGVVDNEMFIQGNLIGSGTYANVYEGFGKKNKIKVALKISNINYEEGVPSTTLREISILKSLKNINIIKIYQVIYKSDLLVIAMEFMDYDLYGFMKEERGMNIIYNRGRDGDRIDGDRRDGDRRDGDRIDGDRRDGDRIDGVNLIDIDSIEDNVEDIVDVSINKSVHLIVQLIKGVEYLHRNRIIHRDLKPGNILVNKQDILKIADFGLARFVSIMDENNTGGNNNSIVNGEYSSEVITLWYRPPELLLGSRKYSYEVDIWSIGCIIYEIITGYPLFPGESINNQFDLIGSMDIEKLRSQIECFNFPSFIIDIMLRSLSINICQRITSLEMIDIISKEY